MKAVIRLATCSWWGTAWVGKGTTTVAIHVNDLEEGNKSLEFWRNARRLENCHCDTLKIDGQSYLQRGYRKFREREIYGSSEQARCWQMEYNVGGRTKEQHYLNGEGCRTMGFGDYCAWNKQSYQTRTAINRGTLCWPLFEGGCSINVGKAYCTFARHSWDHI